MAAAAIARLQLPRWLQFRSHGQLPVGEAMDVEGFSQAENEQIAVPTNQEEVSALLISCYIYVYICICIYIYICTI